MSNSTSPQRNSPWVLLRQQIAQTFSESDLKTICFDLGIDFEELGQGNKTNQIIELIRLGQRQGRLADLRSAITDARPHLSWPTLEALQASPNETYPGTIGAPAKLSREEQLAQRNRQTMLAKVKAYWVDGVLANSLHSKVIPLDMERKLDAVTQPRPWDMLWQHRDQRPQPLPPGARIIDRFNYASGDALLILGDPGSGKTTMLLELARDLLTQATQDESLRIPVVFNLSSWASKRPPLTDWLIAELQTLYLVPQKTAHTWIEQDDVLPLLDGLDEVAEAQRGACIQAINEYRVKQGTPLVVCSRTADYEAIGRKLVLSDALVLRPLTPDQINNYLLAGGPALEGVRLGLQEDEVLQEMAQSPLMLSIMVVAYRNQALEQFTSTNLDERGRQLFATYIQRQLHQRRKDPRKDPREDPATTLRQLTYLAQQMTKREQFILLIEGLQPDWLPNTKQQNRYRRTVELMLGAVSGLTVLFVLGMSFSIVGELGWGLVIGLIGAFISGGVFGRFSGQADIVPIEKVKWSWKYIPVKNGIRRLIGRLIGGLLIGIALSLVAKPDIELSLQARLAAGLILGIVISFVFGPVWMVFDRLLDVIVGGLVSESVEVKTIPNEGIKRSLWNSMSVGLLFGISLAFASGIVGALLLGLVSGLQVGFGFGAAMGLGFGLVGGWIRGGGMAVVQHYSLRFWLYWYGFLPWRLESFLDLTAERVILQKVGGGYRFVHRLLQDYLADLDVRS